MKRFLHKISSIVFLDGDDTRRAPMAAAVFESLAKRDPILGNWNIKISSAGIGDTTISGSLPHPLAVLAIQTLGLNIAQHKASILSLKTLKEASIIVAMEEKHIRYVKGRFPECYPGYFNRIVEILPYLGADFKIQKLVGTGQISDYTDFAKSLVNIYCPRLAYMIVYETLRPLLLQGKGLSTGAVQGRVRLISAAFDILSGQPGDILVSHSTDELMRYAGGDARSAGGIIIDSLVDEDELAQWSHELANIPFVANANAATTLLHDGQLVTMDATAGLVYGEVDA